jgi:hypothetical protein
LRIFRIFHFKPKPSEAFLLRFQRALEATGEPGQGCRRILFLFSDRRIGKVSAVARVIKAYPEAAAFRYDVPAGKEFKDSPPYAAVGNFGPPWMQQNPNNPTGSIPLDTLSAILAGIPRRFPFGGAAITIDGVDWNDQPESLPVTAAADDYPPAAGLGRYLFPSVILNHDTRIFPQAVVEVSASMPHLSDAAKAKIAVIGHPAFEETRVRYEGAERERWLERRGRANSFVDAFKAEMRSWLRSRVILPTQLPRMERAGTDAPFSLKHVLRASFEPFGYRYMPRPSGQGVSELEKRTPSNHRLYLSIDRGTWSRFLTCAFTFSGIEARHSLDLPVHPDQRMSGYPADGQAVVDAVVANWAAIVRALETEFVPRLVAIYGADPEWA